MFDEEEFCPDCERHNKITGKSLDTFHAPLKCPLRSPRTRQKSLDEVVELVRQQYLNGELRNDSRASKPD